MKQSLVGRFIFRQTEAYGCLNSRSLSRLRWRQHTLKLRFGSILEARRSQRAAFLRKRTRP